MSLKPVKKSDQGKLWMTPRRDKPRKIHPEYHLIITEGTKTEPLYFQRIKEIINQKYPEHIQMTIIGQGDNTVNLFDQAKRIVNDDPNGYKHVWIVYDTDDFPAEDINKVPELCRNSSTEDCHYHAIWSNQCIELWYLLHYSFFQSDIHRKAYSPKLSAHLQNEGCGKYQKNRADMFDILRPHLPTAIRNAERLDELNAGKTPAESAPGTKVYEFLEKIKTYL